MGLPFLHWRCGLSRFFNQINLDTFVLAALDQGIPCLGAEMRDIDNGCWIIGAHTQLFSRRQGHQTFARFEDGKGAEQPRGIKVMYHVRRCMPHVTTCPQPCDMMTGDAMRGAV